MLRSPLAYVLEIILVIFVIWLVLRLLGLVH
jgi:hypothetical protein